MRHEGKKGIEYLARFGLLAKGSVYLLIGVLTAMAAFNLGGQTADQQAALASILGQPFGQIILGVVALGLFAYALWRIIQAITDPDNEGSDAKGIFSRLGDAASGLIYASLGLYATNLVLRSTGSGTLGSGGGSGGSGSQTLVATLLSQPFGQWLVGIVAVGIAAFAVYELISAYKEKFMKKEKLEEMSVKEEKTMRNAGKAGYTARSIVFFIIAYFFLRAALQADPSEAQGTQAAFGFLSQSPAGPWLMGLVALGVAAYGVFVLITAKYRHVPTENMGT